MKKIILSFDEFNKVNESVTSSENYKQIEGTLDWELHSKEYEFNENLTGNDWGMFRFTSKKIGDDIILFYSPSNEWMVYCYVWEGHIEWALTGVGEIDFFENGFKNPNTVKKVVIDDFDNWIADNASIPTLDDDCVYPDVVLEEAQALLHKEIKESLNQLDFEPIPWGVEDFDDEAEEDLGIPVTINRYLGNHGETADSYWKLYALKDLEDCWDVKAICTESEDRRYQKDDEVELEIYKDIKIWDLESDLKDKLDDEGF